MLKYGCLFVVKTYTKDNSQAPVYETCVDPRAAVSRAMIVYSDLQMYYERINTVVEAMAAEIVEGEDGQPQYDMLELLWTSEDYERTEKYHTTLVTVYSDPVFMFEAFRKAAAQGAGMEAGFKQWHKEQVADGWSGQAGAIEYREFKWPNTRTGGNCVFKVGRVEYPVILKKVKDMYEPIKTAELFYVHR